MLALSFFQGSLDFNLVLPLNKFCISEGQHQGLRFFKAIRASTMLIACSILPFIKVSLKFLDFVFRNYPGSSLGPPMLNSVLLEVFQGYLGFNLEVPFN